MKLSDDEFKQLQTYWYERLKEEGFKDIERFKDGHWIIVDNIAQIYRFFREDKKNYFYLLGQIVHDDSTVFRNDVDKYILYRYAEGTRINTIAQELIQRGTPRMRDSIRKIIRKYEQAWNIRNA